MNSNESQDSVVLGRPSPARMYDYFLHGSSNYPEDRAAGDAVMAKVGVELTRDVVWENRAFLGRAVQYLAERGVRQFVDLGAGLPSMENTHQVAARFCERPRVLYVDNDPAVEVHGGDILLADDSADTRIVIEDVREPDRVLSHPRTRELIDFSEPVGLLMVAVLHFCPDDPQALVDKYLSALPPGSYLALSHLVVDPDRGNEQADMERSYDRATSPMIFREPAVVKELFTGLDVVAPGIVPVGRWHADGEYGETVGRMIGGVAKKEAL
ncbi:SAM-dependent methyltransferase [Amycolatopsis sp. OK19-0408]|uniref:SAM-dependent methyltransferase n=1 Tax=Amycolatopsis iheyensis TaxID=2945988 RepID=A0A9X2SIJ9_9PSEU|nr:SAM-dependent methyltransferase [Amycolatopsis iheyensis]MCR6483489.1 SAM-dependent methyltransferase [Amycolatopsis iheyensis]